MRGPQFANAGSHRGFSYDLWKRFNPNLFLDHYDPGLGICDTDDFTSLPTGKYTATQATAGTFALKETYGEGGVAEADSNSTTNTQGINVTDACSLLKWEAGALVGFEARVKAVDIATAPEFFLGLSLLNTAIVASGAIAPDDWVGFYCLSDGNLIFGRQKDNGTEQKATAVHTLVDDSWVRLGFVIERNGTAIPYVNGVEQTSKILTGSTAASTDLMARGLVCQSNGTTDPIVAIDAWRVVKEKYYTAG